MSTRGFLGFVVDGTEKIAYNHDGSSPDQLGVNVLRWLRTVPSWELLRGRVRAARVVECTSEPTPDDMRQLREFTDPAVSDGRDWYALLRRTQGDPAAILRAGVIEDASHFPLDSTWAEWGYLIDLDNKTFEIYEGGQGRSHSSGRFADRPWADDDYGPVALLDSWPLSALPDDEALIALIPDEDLPAAQCCCGDDEED
jgi:hypothetical protein